MNNVLLSVLLLFATAPAIADLADEVILYTAHYDHVGMGDTLFGVERIALDQSQTILAIANLADRPVTLNTVSLDFPPGSSWRDLLGDVVLDDTPVDIKLQPYQCMWLSPA